MSSASDVIPMVKYLTYQIEKKEGDSEYGVGTMMDDLRNELVQRFISVEKKK